MKSSATLGAVVLAAALIGAPAQAVPAKPAATAPTAAARSSAWVVDKAASRLGFKSSFGGESFEGAFRAWDASIQFDPKALAGGKVVVSVQPGSVASGDETRDEALPGGDWFNVAKFPRATFTSTGFKPLGPGRYQVDGTLTLRGVTKPISMPVAITVTSTQARATGSVVLNRSQFGVGQGQFKSAESIPFNVLVSFTVVAHH